MKPETGETENEGRRHYEDLHNNETNRRLRKVNREQTLLPKR